MTRGIVLVALAGIAIAASGCARGSARASAPLRGPVVLTAESARRGEKVFMEYCTRCHPGGEAGVGPSLNNRGIPGALVKLQVRNGFGPMPSFSDSAISDRDLDGLVDYLGALRKHSAR